MDAAGNLKVTKGKKKKKIKCKQFTQQDAASSPVTSQAESVSSINDSDST